LTIALLVGAGCQAQQDPGPSGSSPGGTPEPGATSSPPATGGDGALTIATGSLGNENLDPIKAVTDGNKYLQLIFDPLVGVNFAGEEISKETGVAEDWTISDDGLVYTFQIREGIKFHNGDDLTAEDVKFSLDRYKTDDAITPNTSAIRAVLGEINVLGPLEVEVNLTQPKLTFLTLVSGLVDPGGLILPKTYFESVGADGFAQNPVGSGPYRFVERQTGSFITLEKAADDHFAIGAPKFETVTLRFVPEESTRLAMLQAGDADFIDTAVDKVAGLEADGFKIFTHGGVSVLYAFFQLQREGEATLDPHLRAALSYSINRQEINETLLEGLGVPTGNVFPSMPGITPIEPDPFDPDRARAELAMSPYGPDGEELDLKLQVMTREGWPQLLTIAQGIQGYWKDIGVSSTIIYRDFAAFRTEWLAGELPPPAVILENFDAQVDWNSVVTTVWTCDGALSSVCDPELDRLNQEWSQAGSMDEYRERAEPVERMLYENHFVIPIVTAARFFAANDDVSDAYQPGFTVLQFNVRAMVTDR
jgi:ABC-type transport system substrate-binding protein